MDRVVISSVDDIPQGLTKQHQPAPIALANQELGGGQSTASQPSPEPVGIDEVVVTFLQVGGVEEVLENREATRRGLTTARLRLENRLVTTHII